MALRVSLLSVNRYRKPDPVFPLGLAYVADAVAGAGHEVQVLELNVSGDAWLEELRAFAPDVAGVSIRNVDPVQIENTQTLLGELPGVVASLRKVDGLRAIVLGGSAVTLFPLEILEASGADYAIRGEGETAFVELLSSIEAGAEPSAPWLCRRGDSNEPVAAPPGVHYACKSDRRSLAPYYLANSGMLNVQTQRGCPLHCSYCTYPRLEGSRVRHKAAGEVVEEFRMLERLGARYVFVVDAVFNTSRAWVAELCEALARAENRLRWCCFLRPKGIDADLARLMARAGLSHAEIGTDSLSESMLRAYGKRFDFEDVRASSAALLAARIKFCHFIIFGGPGETEDSVNETFALSDELPGSIFMSSIGLRVYPSTPLYESLLREKPSFARRSLLDPVFYVSPRLPRDRLETMIESQAASRSSWISSQTARSFDEGAQRMRSKGVRGPLWDYMELCRRMG